MADRLFNARHALANVEEEVGDFLDEVLGDCTKGAWQDFKHDYYDRSIEIFGVKDDLALTIEQQERFWSAGFFRVWTHTTLERRDNNPGEKAYWKEGVPC
jgi:hypothetical protein